MKTSDIWIGTSWKMNKNLAEAEYFARELCKVEKLKDPRIQRFVIPPHTVVRDVKRILSMTTVMVGAQNMHWEDDGAWTGEVSAPMLKDCNLDLVELGHSERRAHFGETNETVGLKVATAVRHGLIPLVCIGETLEEREAGRAREILEEQVRVALSNLDFSNGAPRLLFAYEPVWAIGDNGIPATAEYADARQAEIIKIAQEVTGERIRCLYGGSVNPNNCEELIQCPNIDGLFIGRSAWQVDDYLDILRKCAAVV